MGQPLADAFSQNPFQDRVSSITLARGMAGTISRLVVSR